MDVFWNYNNTRLSAPAAVEGFQPSFLACRANADGKDTLANFLGAMLLLLLTPANV